MELYGIRGQAKGPTEYLSPARPSPTHFWAETHEHLQQADGRRWIFDGGDYSAGDFETPAKRDERWILDRPCGWSRLQRDGLQPGFQQRGYVGRFQPTQS